MGTRFLKRTPGLPRYRPSGFGWLLGWVTVLILLLLASVPEVTAQSEKWEEVFFQANQAYRAGEFDRAVKEYQRLIKAGYTGGHLLFNLGNAYYRMDELGEAILHYERAKAVIPRDADLRFNLAHAKDQVIDSIAGDPGLVDVTFFWIDSINLQESFWIFAAANFLFWAVLAVRHFIRSELLYYALLFSAAFWLVSGISLGVKWIQVKTDNRAVVVQKEIEVRSGPDIHDTVLFKLHEGTIVRLERSEGQWSLVQVSENKRGWTGPEAIVPVRALGPEAA